MVGEQAAQDMELASASNTPEHTNDAFVALMKTIRSNIVEALQFVDQQHPMPANADSTDEAVAWLSKNKDKLLQVIRNLATPENKPAATSPKSFMDVIHAHRPSLERSWHQRRASHRCSGDHASHRMVCSASSTARTHASRSNSTRSCALHTLSCRPRRRSLGSCWYSRRAATHQLLARAGLSSTVAMDGARCALRAFPNGVAEAPWMLFCRRNRPGSAVRTMPSEPAFGCRSGAQSCGPTYALPSTDWRWPLADYSRRVRCDQVAR